MNYSSESQWIGKEGMDLNYSKEDLNLTPGKCSPDGE